MKRLLGELYDAVFAYGEVCEIRLNLLRPVEIVTRNRSILLPAVCTQRQIDNCVAVATDYSVYTAVSKMVQGYLPYVGGVRIGVAGKYCVQNGFLHQLQQPTGLVIRLPHEIIGCSRVLDLDKVIGKNVLVVSPPFGGKTTFIRDFALRLGSRCHVVVIDERDELAGNGKLHLGECMTVSGAPKELVFKGVVRALNPYYVVTDELDVPRDLEVVKTLISCGIRVVATVHGDANTMKDNALSSLFDVCVRLSSTPVCGHVEEVAYA